MKIPAGEYKLEVAKKIYKSGEIRKSGREFERFMSFQDGTEFTLKTEEDKLTTISFDMEIHVDVENKIIRLG